MEGHPDDGPAGHGEDDAGEGGGLRVQDDLLQRQLLHADLKVPRRVGEDGQDPLRDRQVGGSIQRNRSVINETLCQSPVICQCVNTILIANIYLRKATYGYS